MSISGGDDPRIWTAVLCPRICRGVRGFIQARELVGQRDGAVLTQQLGADAISPARRGRQRDQLVKSTVAQRVSDETGVGPQIVGVGVEPVARWHVVQRCCPGGTGRR